MISFYLPITSSLRGILNEFPGKNVENRLDKKVVVVAKHLCGVATDYALRALGNLSISSSTSPYLSSSARGAAIATCCHHACNLSDYCGREQLLEYGFTPAEFEVTMLSNLLYTFVSYC